MSTAISCNCSARHGAVPRNMCGHEESCPEYFAWACRIVFKLKHTHSNALRSECPGCLPAWESPFRRMISSVVDFHAARDGCESLHVEIAAEKPQFDQVMIAYCCDGCGAHGAQGVPGAFREKVRGVRENHKPAGGLSFSTRMEAACRA